MTLQTLSVEYDELMARADELAAVMPGPPAENPQAPCALEMVVRTTQQLRLSAENMRLYLSAGEREQGRLAQSLRNAAKAYVETDQEAEQALNDETPVSAVTLRYADPVVDPAMLTDTVSLMVKEPLPYYSVREAAEALSHGDQGTSFLNFADGWAAYQRTLLEARYQFRPFRDWYSEASLRVEQNFDSERGWLDQMAALCGQMAAQARGVVSAHRWAVKEHPTVWQIQQIDGRWITYQGKPGWSEIKPQLLAYYAKYQEKSEAVLAEYERRAGLPLPPVSPPKPPTAYKIDAPTAPGPRPGPGPGPAPGPEPQPLPDNGLPSTGTATPSTPFASTPSMPTDPKLTDALTKLYGAPAASPGARLKPASFGGDGASVPSMPLQPSGDSVAASGPATAPGDASLGRGIPSLSGARGGASGMPMGAGAPGGQAQGAGKGRRVQQEGALYIENRAWTEAIIGRRPAKTPATN